jgi:transposase
MLDRHTVQELLRAKLSARRIARQLRISVRTVRRIARETPIESVDAAAAHARHPIGRRGVPATVRERVKALLTEDAERPPGEVWRLLRDEGTPFGLSTVYRLIAAVRPTLPTPLMVRFEGIAGEFAQFDFGETTVRLLHGKPRVVHFAAYRLKYSRWIHVVLVRNERIEALVRALLASFAAAGNGMPLAVVFDNPKTVVVKYEDGRPVWNATLGQVAIDYGFTVELCAPRQPQQKGSVENLVGFVKRSFFRARIFHDLETDLPRQLAEWLVEVNTVRPCRATKEIPAARLPAEQARLKPLAIAPDAYGLRFAVTVGPTAMVTHQGIRYAMPAAACGIPATLTLYPDRVKIVTGGGRHEVTHPRFPTVGAVSYLPGQRAAQLQAVFGKRKRLYFMRERLLELGPVGEAYLTELVHQRPHTWAGDVARLFALLEELGEPRFRLVLQRALFQHSFGAEYVIRLVARLPEQLELPELPASTTAASAEVAS